MQRGCPVINNARLTAFREEERIGNYDMMDERGELFLYGTRERKSRQIQ